MTSNEIRKAFLDFFESKGHKIVPSAPIVVKNDPTLMFINSGMAPFKDIFLGNQPIKYARIADTQKCLRVSGKHNDLEEVGVDTYHHTMFEMLGNWSFGDYFKKDAIAWSWQLLTEVYGLDKDRLYVTVFEGDAKENLAFDQESYDYWKAHTSEDRILRGNKKDNFWEMGDTGPCGPCSEIHIDLRSEEERKAVKGADLVNSDNPKVIEIWNNVFMEFERKADKSLVKLPKQHVDTGMGFERLCVAVQGKANNYSKTSNYDTDLFQPLIQKVADMANVQYHGTSAFGNINTPEGRFEMNEMRHIRTDVALRVISDHIRAISFTIADGQLPSNTGAGYVIRRILRRAVRYGYSYLKFEGPFLNELVPLLAEQFANVFPQLKEQQGFVATVIKEEETSFFKTLVKGLKQFELNANILTSEINRRVLRKFNYRDGDPRYWVSVTNFLDPTDPEQTGIFKELKEKNVSIKSVLEELEIQLQNNYLEGEFVFKLFDQEGFPLDLTKLLATERNLRINEQDFVKRLQEQKDRGRADAATEQSDWVSVGEDVKTDFIGYDYNEADAHVVKYRSVKQKDKELYQIVLDKTPFYAESGGQVGDTGYLDFGGEKIDVLDTKKENDLIVHFVKQLPKQVDAIAHAKINERRRADTVKNHSATHLLQSALRQVLGTHVQQKGSLVNSDYLRFDFSHFSKMTDEEVAQVERIVNEKIMENIPLDERRNVPIADAEKLGATMLFGEKYGEFVRVITFDEKFSRELCGGTHAKSTGEIGLFKIISEASVAAGVRRIEALTGKNALQYVDAKLHELNTIAATFKGAKSVAQAVAALQEQVETLRKENEQLQDKMVAGLAKQLKTESERLVNNHFIAKTGIEVTSADALRKLGILLVNELKDNFVILLSAHINGKYIVHLRIAPGLGINGNALLKEIAPNIKGGGPADFVQASAANGNEVEELCKKLHEKFNS